MIAKRVTRQQKVKRAIKNQETGLRKERSWLRRESREMQRKDEEEESRESKESKEKRKMQCKNEEEELRYRIRELPSNILFQILQWMDIKHAVQIFILSKGWKDLWKSIITFFMNSKKFKRVFKCDKFGSDFLSHHDTSISLHNVDVVVDRSTMIRT